MANQRQLSNEELAAFCSQIAILLKGGVTPAESLRVLLSDTEDKTTKELLESMFNSVMDGETMAEALKITGVFPDYVLNTVKLGEEAGSTDEVFSSLAEFYDREAQIQENIKSAVTYPLVMVFMMIIVILVLITKVLPIFSQVFVQLGSEMTGFAASLLQFGKSLSRYSIAITVVIVALIGLYLFCSKTKSGKKLSNRFLTTFILTRSFYEDVAIGRFASGLALSQRSGLDTFRGLDMVTELVEHSGVLAKIGICREALLRGDNLAEALKESQMFSNVNNRLISVGIKTGDVDEVMSRIAGEYQRRSEKKLSRVISIIEPTLVIILSVIVGLILLSVILPLLGIMSNIG